MPEIHPFILIIDYILGVVMWTLNWKSCNEPIFQKENSEFFFHESICKINKSINKTI